MNRTNLPEQMGYANGGDVDPEDFLAKADTLDAAGDTTRISRAPTSFHGMAQERAKRDALRYMHDRHIPNRHDDDLLYAGVDPEFARMLLQADPEISITSEIKPNIGRTGRYREYSTTFPKEVEGIGVPNPPLVRGLPDRTPQEVAAMSEEDMKYAIRRDLAGENVMAALLSTELSKQRAGEPTRFTEMEEVRDLMERNDRLPAHLSAQTDSILDEIRRGEGRVRRTPDMEALLELIARKRKELVGFSAGGGIYTVPHLAQMAGGGIYTIPMAGGGMYVPGYGLGGFFRGLSKVASAASFIPGLQAFSIPIAAASGAIGGAMDGGGIQGALKGGAGGFIGAKAGQALGGLGGAASKGADIASKAGTLAKGADVASKAGTLAKGADVASKAAQGASTLSKILDVAQHPAMMAMGYPLLGELLGSVGGGGLGKMGAPTSSRGGESIQRVMPSYVADRQAAPTRAQGYTGPIALQSRQRGGMMEEGGEMGIPDFVPQPVRPRRPIPEYTAPVIRRRPDLNIDRPVRPEPALPPPPSRERREETSEIEDRFERVERRAAPREDRRGRRERPEDQRERGPREGGGDLSGTEERTTRDAEPEGRGTSYEEGRYRYGDRMTEEQKRKTKRFKTQDEFGDADESAEMENIRAIAKGTPSDDIVSIDGTMIEGESPYDDSPTSMPGFENPELLARRDRDLGAAPVVVGPPTGQFTPQAYEIADVPDWYRAGLMSEQALETGQPETFLGQDPFSVFAGQQQDPISMFRGPAAPQAPLQMPNMPFLQQGQPQMGPPPPMIADPGDKFSRPRIEAPRRVVPAEQQMQPPMQMPQPVQPLPDFMPQPMQQMPVGRMQPPPQVLEGRADGGMAPQDIPFEGFIEPFEDGTMESSGAVDDRVAVMKPRLSEVGPEQTEMLSALKNALRNPTSEVSRQIIELARNTFGEKFITNLMEDMLSAGNNPMVESQDDMDRLVEMEFRQNLAEGGSVRVGAAIAPNEYVLTASQVRNVGGGNTEEGARRIKKLARNIDIAGSKTDGPLNVEIV